MSSGGQRPPANRMTLQTFKARLGGAKKGWSLLKKKRDALKSRFHLLLKDIVDAKLQVGQGLKDGGFALAKAHWSTAGDDITSTVIERARRPSVTCKLSADNIAGVQIPTFKMMHDATKDTSAATLGVSHGGAVINACRVEFLKAITQLVRLASLQTAFKTLDEEIKMTSRRVNALEYVLIPRIEIICAYIILEMDEESREEFFRVKKVVEKKRQKIAKEKLEDEAEDAKAAAKTDAAKAAGKAAASVASVAAEEAAPAPAPAPEQGAGKKAKKAAKAAFDAPSALPSKKDDDLVF